MYLTKRVIDVDRYLLKRCPLGGPAAATRAEIAEATGLSSEDVRIALASIRRTQRLVSERRPDGSIAYRAKPNIEGGYLARAHARLETPTDGRNAPPKLPGSRGNEEERCVAFEVIYPPGYRHTVHEPSYPRTVLSVADLRSSPARPGADDHLDLASRRGDRLEPYRPPFPMSPSPRPSGGQ